MATEETKKKSHRGRGLKPRTLSPKRDRSPSPKGAADRSRSASPGHKKTPAWFIERAVKKMAELEKKRGGKQIVCVGSCDWSRISHSKNEFSDGRGFIAWGFADAVRIQVEHNKKSGRDTGYDDLEDAVEDFGDVKLKNRTRDLTLMEMEHIVDAIKDWNEDEIGDYQLFCPFQMLE
jgi:hypothetical protein